MVADEVGVAPILPLGRAYSGLPVVGGTAILPFSRPPLKVFGGMKVRHRDRQMRYHLVDRLIDLDPGRQIRMVKALTLGEEYLADHFPTFPVMPGVLMLQTLVEAGAWLLRLSDDYRHSVIVLREA